MRDSRYQTFFAPPAQGWPEPDPNAVPEPEPPRQCHFKNVICPELVACSQCEHWRKELL